MLGSAVLCRTFGSGLWKMLFGEQVIYLFCGLWACVCISYIGEYKAIRVVLNRDYLGHSSVQHQHPA